jgi:iron complex outermembrane receptor protein
MNELFQTIRRVVLCVALIAMAFPPAAVCQSGPSAEQPPDSGQLKSLSLEQLGQVEVTTYRKTPTELWDTPAAVYVITADDIARSGATSIADALRLAPGVEVGRLSSTTWAVGIRGLESNFSKSVLVLIDGRSVYTPLFAGVYWDIQDMPLDNIDHIEIIRGPGGTIWGPNAANGIINIITKSAAGTQGITAHALAGTADHTIDDLQYGGSARNISFRLFGRGFEREHEFHTDGLNEDAWNQQRLGLRADLVRGRDTFFAAFDTYLGTSPHIIGTTPVYDETSGGDINLRWQRDFSDANGFYVQAYFDRTIRGNPASIGETRNTIDIDFIHHFRLSARQQFSYGGGLRWSPYGILPPNPGETLTPASGLDHIYTGFVQDVVQLAPKLSLSLGAKLQQNNFSGFDIQPSARLLWSLASHQALWFGFTRAVTTPSDIEEDFLLQGAEGPHTFLQVVGNKSFQSEDVDGYEAGYRVLAGSRLYLDLAAFWSQYSHLQSFSAPILSASGGNTYITIQYQNQIAGSTSGFEFAPQIAVAPWWRLNLSYAFVSSDFSANGPTSDISSTGSVSTYEHSSPRHQVSVQSKLDLPWRIQFDQTYRFLSDLPAQKVPAYQTMDVILHKSLGRNLVLEAVGQNLFQPHHYEWGTGDPTQPLVGINRAGYLQLTFQSAAPKPSSLFAKRP